MKKIRGTITTLLIGVVIGLCFGFVAFHKKVKNDIPFGSSPNWESVGGQTWEEIP